MCCVSRRKNVLINVKHVANANDTRKNEAAPQ